MEPKRRPQGKSDALPEREKVKLDRRYGEIGISAVKAARAAPRGTASAAIAFWCKNSNRRQGS